MNEANGSLLTILLAVIGGLFGIVQGLVGIVVKMHMTSDDEHRIRVETDIKALRERSHDLADKLSGLLAKEHMRRLDDNK
jgi:hypothetical protein